MAQVKIGWSEVSITPDKKISLTGQFAERISEYVEKPLTATAMAVECGGDQMVIVGCDLAAIEEDLVVSVREALAGNTAGIDPAKVILNAIHTHTGPGYSKRGNTPSNWVLEWYGNMKKYLREDQVYEEAASITGNPEIATDEEVFDLLVERITGVILSAWENRKEGSFKNAFDRAAVGMCRRVDYSDDTAQRTGQRRGATRALHGVCKGAAYSCCSFLLLLWKTYALNPGVWGGPHMDLLPCVI